MASVESHNRNADSRRIKSDRSAAMLLSSLYARLSHFRLNSGTNGIGALSFGAKFKLALGPYPRPNSVTTRTDFRADNRHTLNVYFSFFLLLPSKRAERDAPTKAAVQRRY